MSKTQMLIAISVVLLTAGLFTLAESQTAQQQLIISTRDQVADEFKNVPCKNQDREDAARALFQKMGASSSEITVEKLKGVENLVVRKKGTSEEKIIVGAHYDKVEDGCGAIDNWTGIVTVAHLYKTFRNVTPNKTILFVAFGREEDGLVGSEAMARAITKEEKNQYCAMINIDSLGMGAPQVTDETSGHKLGVLAEELADRLRIPFAHSSFVGADSDAHSFKAKGIPTLDIHGLTKNWRQYLHSSSDKVSNVNMESVYLGYRFVLAALVSVDSAACSAYR
ncbi:MAG TPA: M20/M25/M40 family metallo-hydrolase [Blastocatellia bacterium]|nr:M20/M25/M40 family metallo-hydrolase [Blastocatellia bacterium]